MSNKNLQTLKIIFLGDKSVGKTTFITNYTTSTNQQPSSKKNKDKDSVEFNYQLPDTTTSFKIKIKQFSEKNDKLIDHINKSDCVIIIFEMTSRKSFENLFNYWLIFLRDTCHYKGEVIVFGNHINKKEELRVDEAEIKELLDICGLNCSFFDIGKNEIEDNNKLIDNFIKTAYNKSKASSSKKDCVTF